MEDQRTGVFLDACVLMAASISPSGGSSLVIDVCRGRKFKAILTMRVILEARLNILEKYGEPGLIKFYQLLANLDPEIAATPSIEKLGQYASLVNAKDAHVLVSALQCGGKYLITLDKKHLLTPAIQSAGLSIKVINPGDFLREISTDR